ncbi:DUF1642 domain-containing protein [Lactococcus garvieae]|uniref:DUF1642 domain-containing protein n=1 Tax=Lactococcus garvieae TaxID=1363 RepID=UPI001CE244E3|nr:DUF1642 domain-containing protein [Lactococcus garvieae]
MTKFELPEKPKKTNTSEDFNNLRKAVDELDKFDYAWKTHANKADRRINAANKYIEKLERENQRLIAENVAIKTLVDKAKPQQALPVVPECVAEWYESHGESSESLEFYIYLFCGKFYSSRDSRKNRELTNFEKWFGEDKNKPIETLIRMQDGYTVEKPQLFYLKNKLTTSYLILDTSTGYFEHWSSTEATGRYKSEFTQAEIDSMQTGSYELVPVEV